MDSPRFPINSDPRLSVGGALSQYVGYRYVFVCTAAVTLILIATIFFFLPETLPPRAPGTKPPRINPLSMLPALRHPWVLIPIWAQSLTWGALYSQVSMLARQLYAAYEFQETAVGVYGLTPALGNILGAVGGGFIADRILNSGKGGSKIPEFRLYSVHLAVALSFVGLTAFGWILQAKVHWAAGIPFQFLWGVGMMLAMTPTGTYLVVSNVRILASVLPLIFRSQDIYRPSAASISAVANLCRLILASLTPLISPAMQSAMTVGGLYTFWGGILVVTVIPGILWMTTVGYKKRLAVAPWNAEGNKPTEMVAVDPEKPDIKDVEIIDDTEN